MTCVYLIKKNGFLIPSSECDQENIALMTDGKTYKCEFSSPRNIRFHRRYFALLDVLFNIFDPEPVSHKGEVAIKNRERFRKDIAIATGHYELVVSIKGECKAEAKSISFASMDETKFSELYSRTIDYGLLRIAKGKTKEEIDNWVAQIMDFS